MRVLMKLGPRRPGVWALAVAIAAMVAGMVFQLESVSSGWTIRLFGFVTVSSWMVASLTLRLPTRFTEFELTLPATGGHLLTARLLTALGRSLLAPFLGLGVCVMATRDAAVLGDLARAFVSVTSAIALATVLVVADVYDPGRPMARLRFAGRCAVGLIGVVAALVIGELWLGAVLATLAAWCGVFAAQKAPDAPPLAMDLAPLHGSKQSVSAVRRPYSLHRLLLNRTVLNWRSMLLLVAVFVYAVAGRWVGFEFWVVLFGAFALGNNLRVLKLVGHLPVSRRRVFAYAALPSMLCLFAGTMISSRLVERSKMVEFWSLVDVGHDGDESGHGFHQVRVPKDLLRLTDHAVPLVRSPTGETHRPRRQQVLFGVGLGAYNPYEVGPESSRAFLAFQLSRAMTDAYGVDVSADEVESRYLGDEATCAAQSFNPEWSDSDLARQRPVSQSILRSLLWLVALLLMMVGIVPSNLPLRSRAQRIWRQVPGILIFLSMLVPIFWELQSKVSVEVFYVHWLAAWGPIPTIGTTLVFCVFIYFWVEQRFVQLEPPAAAKQGPIPDRSMVAV